MKPLFLRCACALYGLTALIVPSSAAAQDRPDAAILDIQLGAEAAEETGGAVGRLLRAELDGLDVVRTSSGVALDLSEVQLALGCVGETVACLGPVAGELDVRYLLIPHLDRGDDGLMLTLALFDGREETIARTVRRAPTRAALLDAVEGQLRELFELPPAPDPPDPVASDPAGERSEGPPTASTASPSTGPARSEGGVTPLPFVLLGVGAAALGAGAVFGVASQDNQSEWETVDRGSTREEVDAGHDAIAEAETFAIVADVFFVVGGLAVAGGVAALVVELVTGGSDDGEGADAVVLAPSIGPSTLGLAAWGRWGAR
ncbi:MAG TPA: hypothetical protein RMH99_10560 [Sandaracinaceae bacterium LLY-WYZ-13_1]|nr:hypothetical protein [Sandaracinaceae bacterium LLY-WYZ-13_1]